MKRDLDLVREILLTTENSDDIFGLMSMNFDAEHHTQAEIVSHLNWLNEAGYLKLVRSEALAPGDDDQNPIVARLTWEGCEFLEVAKDDTRWNKAKEVAGKAGSFAFELLKPILVELAKQALTSAVPGLRF